MRIDLLPFGRWIGLRLRQVLVVELKTFKIIMDEKHDSKIAETEPAQEKKD